MPPLFQAARERKQKILAATKIPAGVDVSNLENAGGL